MKKNATRMLMSAAVAGIIGGALASAAPAFADDAQKGHCIGANGCKGQGSCKGAKNSCKGENGCGGKGFLENTKAECDSIKTEWSKSDDKKKVMMAKKIKWEAPKKM